MAQWAFWGDKEVFDIYEDIYIRTFVEDWFKIVFYIADEVTKVNGKLFLDVGCGEGHTTKQIIDRVEGNYVYDLLEPNEKPLASAKKFLSLENDIGYSYLGTLSNFNSIKKYNIIFTSHTNYYWASNEEDYIRQLDKLIPMLDKNGKLMVLTLPEESDHYNIMLKQVYPKFNYSSFMINHYKKKGLNVKVKRFRMRMYVGDLLNNVKTFDLDNFYRFIHNTDKIPNKSEREEFLKKIKKYQKSNYLDFKDELIIVSKH